MTGDALYAWLQYGPAGLEIRALITEGASCPQLLVDEVFVPMTIRATADSDFPVVT